MPLGPIQTDLENSRRMLLYCLYLIALAWPLGAYQRVAGPVHVHHLAFIPLFWNTFQYWRIHKRLQTPFELFWPCAVICILTLGAALSGYEVALLDILGLCGAFVVLYQNIHSRREIWTGLLLSLLSGAAMVTLSLLSRFNWILPTTFSPETRLVMAGPYSLAEGTCSALLLLLAACSLLFASRVGDCHVPRISLLAFLFLLVPFALFILFPFIAPMPFLNVSPELFVFPLLLPALVAIWGCARIAAKLVVASTHMPGSLAVGLPVIICTGVCVVVSLGESPSLGPVFLLALLAARSKPQLKLESSSACSLLPIVPLIGLVCINLALLLPGDPRNYEVMALQRLATGDYAALRAHLAFIKDLAPGERRADYYIARSYLSEGRLNQAAASFACSIGSFNRSSRILPPPGATEIDSFLNDLRDISSGLPEQVRGLAYEKALIAADRERHAFSLLELRGTPLSLQGVSSVPLAKALAELLGVPSAVSMLSAWSPGLLAAILESGGPFNAIIAAPPDFPPSHLPCVVMLRPTQNYVSVRIFTPAGDAGGMKMYAEAPDLFLDAASLLLENSWGDWHQDAKNRWKLDFGSSIAVYATPRPEVVFLSDIAPLAAYPLEEGEVSIFVPGALLDNE